MVSYHSKTHFAPEGSVLRRKKWTLGGESSTERTHHVTASQRPDISSVCESRRLIVAANVLVDCGTRDNGCECGSCCC